jgi:hypothetical protein
MLGYAADTPRGTIMTPDGATDHPDLTNLT